MVLAHVQQRQCGTSYIVSLVKSVHQKYYGCNRKDDAGEALGLACGLGSFGGMLSKEH